MTIDEVTQKMYENIIKDIPIPTVIVTNGVITGVNPSFPLSSIVGGAVGIPFIDFVLSQHQETVANYLKNPKKSIEFEMYSGAGAIDDTMVVVASSSPISGGQVIYLNDITEKRHSKARRLGNILDSCGIVFASYKNNNLVYLNKAAEGLYGVDSGAFISGGRHFSEFVHPDDIGKYNDFMKCILEDEFKDIDYRIKSPRGIRWVRHKGNIIYSFGGKVRRIDHILTDITSEKKAQEELKKSEEKYKHIFNNSPGMLYIVDSKGRFVSLNPAGQKLLGITQAQVSSSRIQDFYVDSAERRNLVSELNSNGEIYDYRVKFKTIDGIKDVSICAIAMPNGSEENNRYIGIVSDVGRTVYETLRATINTITDGLNSKINTVQLQADELLDIIDSLSILSKNAEGYDRAVIANIGKNIHILYEAIMETTGDMARVTKTLSGTHIFNPCVEGESTFLSLK